jgi:hypothetical protein
MMVWIMLHPKMTPEHLGFIPSFLSEDDPEPAAKQIHKNYTGGGGWFPMHGFEKEDNNVLQYPGDPPLKPLAMTMLRKETILFYQHDIVCIVQPDGTWEAARLD